MSTKDKALMIAAVVIGAVVGNHLADIVGAIVGGFAGLGVLVVGYAIADEADSRLREHYRKI